mgnify:CR=1 FL=1
MKYLIVRYDYSSGENGHPGMVVLGVQKRTDEDAIHNYFRRFFFQDTETEEKARYYTNKYAGASVKITGWNEIPRDDAMVLKKYGLYA